MAGAADSLPPAVRPTWRQWDWILIALLTVSLGLRGMLIKHGGAGFWADETRYDVSVGAVSALRDGRPEAATEAIFSKADHLGFKVAMMLPAWGQAVWGWSNGVVAFLGSGLFSTLNIAWVYALARRTGASVAEARWSALVMASSASMFYWSRHLVPYDMALFWGLACLFVGLNPAGRWWHSLIAGMFGFLAFVTYNGAWLFVAFALVAHVLRGWPSWKNLVARACFGLLGLAGSIGLLAAWTDHVGMNLFAAYANFAGTIDQGDYDEGYKVLLGYLWEAEHGLMVIWGFSVGIFLVLLGRKRESELGRPALWLSGVVVIGAALVLFSDGFRLFVVYGRTARLMVPLLALLGGWSLARLAAASWARRWLAPVLVAILVAVAAVNFLPPLRQVFPVGPAGFYEMGSALRKTYLRNVSDEAEWRRLNDKFKFLYTGFIWPVPEQYHLPAHEVLLRRPHPLAYEPYLYEGFNREQRQAMHATDISMCLVLIKD
jgi:hypothetical protein